MSLTTGGCLMLLSLAKDINNDLLKINEFVSTKKNRPFLIEKIIKITQFHSDAKQLTKNP